MTIIRAQFEYPAKIRKHGHRKLSEVRVRETGPFEIPDVAHGEAPVALSLRASRPAARGIEHVRAIGDGLFAPVLGPAGEPVAAADYDPRIHARLATALCETPVASLFDMGMPELESVGDLAGAGHHMIDSGRDARLAEISRRTAASLAAIDGRLHMRIPEPMYVVAVEWTRDNRNRPAVVVDFDQSPGHLCPAGLYSHGSVAHLRLDQIGLAEDIAAAAAERLDCRAERREISDRPTGRAMPFLRSPAPGRRVNEPDVKDASLLRADPLLVTLDQSIRSLLALGHEALAAAPDAFVLAWADMRESLALIRSGHADAVELATAAIRDFHAHAPGEDQFVTGAERKRWTTRTLPLLSERLAAIGTLSGVPALSPGPA